MRKNVFTGFFFVLPVLFAFAQSQSKLDSLKELIARHPTDTIGVDALNLLSQYLYRTEGDSSQLLARQAESLAKKLDYKKGLAYAYHNLGTNYSERQENDSSLFYLEKSLAIKRALNDSASVSRTLNNLGGIYFFQGNYTSALRCFQESLTIKFQLGDTLGASSGLNNVALVYKKQENYDLALDYYQQSLGIRTAFADAPGKAFTLGSIGSLLLSQENYPRALTYITQAFHFYDSSGNNCKRLQHAINLGYTYLGLTKLDSALKYLELGYEDANDCNQANSKSDVLHAEGLVYAEKGLKKLAEDKLLESFRIAEEYDLKDNMMETAEALYDFYKSIGKSAKALKFLEIYRELKDQLFNKELTEELTTMELNYAFEKERDSLEFQKQKELLSVHVELDRQRLLRNFAVFGLFAAIIVVFIIYRLKQKANENLKKKNEMQEEKLKLEETMRKTLEFENNQKARSLTATSMQLLNLNEKLKEVIDDIHKEEYLHKEAGNKLIKKLDQLRNGDNQWDSIKIHFENVHPHFFEKLDQSFPDLSSNDHKLLAYLKMKLSNKEIAIILNVTSRAVEQAKRRLKKKLGMDAEDSDIITHIEKTN